MKTSRNVSSTSNNDLSDLLLESFCLKENVSPQFSGTLDVNELQTSRTRQSLSTTRRGRNHFYISQEELECDENGTIVDCMKQCNNVFEKDYESARPFKQLIQRQQMIDMEIQLNEQVKRLERIRLECANEFNTKLSQYLRTRPPTTTTTTTTKEVVTSTNWRSPPTQTVHPSLAHSNTATVGLTSEPTATTPPSATMDSMNLSSFAADVSMKQTNSPTSSLTSNQGSGSVQFRLTPLSANQQASTSTIVNTTLKALKPMVAYEGLEECSENVKHHSIITTSQDSKPEFTATRSPLSQLYDEQKSLLPDPDSAATISLASKFTHPTLTRTDPNDSGEHRRFINNNNNNQIHETTEIEISTTNEDAIIEDSGKPGSGPGPGPKLPEFSRPSILDEWIELKEKFEASIEGFNKSPRNTLRADLKCTINEKTALWTKKYATEDEISQIVRFFGDLLSGVTVFGFKDKRINLKDESDDARDWAIAHIINAYISLVIQDLSLANVVAAILSQIASRCERFASFLLAKLCASSLILSMDFPKCALKLLELSANGTSVAVWSSRETALIRLFAAIQAVWTTRIAAGNEQQQQQENELCGSYGSASYGAPLIWLLTVAVMKQDSPFASALLNGLLSQNGWILRSGYRKQFDKLLELIGEKIIPKWESTLETAKSSNVISSCQWTWLTTLKDSYDKGYFLQKH